MGGDREKAEISLPSIYPNISIPKQPQNQASFSTKQVFPVNKSETTNWLHGFTLNWLHAVMPGAQMTILINIDDTLSQPIYRQIVAEIKKAIEAGVLKAGKKLPSTRELGKALGISRFTVMRSYDDLASAGYINIITGSGAVVGENLDKTETTPRQSSELSQLLPATKPGTISRFSQQVARAARLLPSANLWQEQLHHGAPASDLLPISRWKEVLNCATREIEKELTQTHQEPCGSLELRQEIVDYLHRQRRVKCNTSQVITFSSYQNAFDFVVRMLIDNGDQCAIESPGLPDNFRALLASGATLHPVEGDSSGMSVQGIRDIGCPLKLICLTPSRNPLTATTMTGERRQEILALAEEKNCFVIENDLDHEFRYGTKAIASLQSMDNQGRVIYIGSFAQVLGPLCQTAYIVLPAHFVSVGKQLKSLIETDYAPIEQTALAKFMQQGYYERHIKKTNEIYAERRAALIHGLTIAFGKNIKHIASQTGTSLIVSFQASTTGARLDCDTRLDCAPMNCAKLAEAARKHRITMVALNDFCKDDEHRNEYLVSFGHLSAAQISERVSALAQELLAQELQPKLATSLHPLLTTSESCITR